MSNTGLQASFRQLVGKLRKQFLQHNVDLVIKTVFVSRLSQNEFYVNAYYDQESDHDNECAIEVMVYHCFKKGSIFEFEQLSQFLVQIYDAVAHEFRHREQARARNFKPNGKHTSESDTIGYLSDPDELDAYSLSIAIELIRALGKGRALSYLRRASRLAMIRPKGAFASPTLFHYFRVFGGISNPIIRKLLKKVYLNIVALDTAAIFYYNTTNG